MENQNPRVPLLWEHSLTTLLGHDPTSDPDIALRQWVHFEGVHNTLDLLSWDQEEAVPPQQVYSLDDHGQGLYLRTNQIKQICGLITYMEHVFGAYNSDIDPRDDPFHPFTPHESSQQTSTMLRTYLIQHLPNPNGPEPVLSVPIPSSGPTEYSPAVIELMGFKTGIKREIAACHSLKDERYLDGFKRSLLIVAKTHERNEVLNPNYTPGSAPGELIQFPPEMDENWVRYGLAKLGQISELPNWQRMLFCAYTTQLLHSTGEVCWNNNDSYFIWFEFFVCRNSGQIASRRSWKRSCLGLEYTSNCSRLALLWEPN